MVRTVVLHRRLTSVFRKSAVAKCEARICCSGLCMCRVMRDLKGARVVAGALVEATEDEMGTDGNAGGWMDLSIMMEEYLDGPEVDVDLVFSQKQAVYGAITDNWPTVEPYFNETGSNCPSLLSRKEQMELMSLGIQSVQCMDFDAGAAFLLACAAPVAS